MSALVKKEIRLLLPSFGAALLLAFSVWLVPQETSEPSMKVWVAILPFVLCPAMVLKMTLDSFGGEISSGTFSNLLSQPTPRSSVWWTKTFLLAIALTLVAGAWWLSFIGKRPQDMTARNLHELAVTTLLFGIAVYSGGLWTVLLLRQVAAAFWFTLLVPSALAMFTMYFTDKFADISATGERNMTIVLVVYSVTGFLWARRMFLRAQDIQWTGATIALPSWLKLPQWVVPIRTTEGRRPRLALLAKEFQLHQSQLVIAGALALLHLGMIMARKAGGGFKGSPVLELATFQFWVLWLVMPLLIGCAAVAEERKLGTLEAQLCLPARRRTQFVIKFGFALMLAIVFGVIAPVLLEGRRILPNFHANMEAALTGFYGSMPQGILLLTVVEVVNALDPWLPLLPLFLIAVGFAAISFYASTLVRNTLQAIAPAIFGVLVAWALLLGAHPSVLKDFVHYPLWRGPLIYFIGIPALGVTLAGLTYWNFKRALVGWPVWRRNLVVFVTSLALVIAMTSAIYHRAWEFLITPREPAHGAVRLTQSQMVAVQNLGNDISVQLADGRVWSTRYAFSTPGWAASLLGDWRVVEMFGGGRFLKGTNWAMVAHCAWDVIGLQKDGSLWVSEQPENPWRIMRRGQPLKREAIKLVKFGIDSDWKNLVGRWTEAFMLKNDGTLWHVGTNQFKGKTIWPGLRSFAPRRVGADSDWAEIFSSNNVMALRKKDGRVYVYPPSSTSPVESLTLDANMSVERAPYLEGHRWRSTAWSQTARIGGFQVGVAEDGKFCVSATWQPVSSRRLGQTRWVAQDIQLGKESNWLAVAGNGESVVTLRADGSLWEWHFKDDPLTKPESAYPTRLGKHSDWLAVVGAAGGVVSLAADGTLWFWRFEPQNFYTSQQGLVPLLGATRKPQLIANIFGKAE